ncbi:MAG TPA: hypothetical protein PK950_01870 [Candidatus Paceibacterota bacterium]|nr:hypothetical protein [Candidatus Paceibacterota bacterium]
MQNTLENERLMKLSNWAVRVVADQTGKSVFENFTPTEFSEYLYTLMRYRSKHLFKSLATILKSEDWALKAFWKEVVEENNPEKAVGILDTVLLATKPRGWNKMDFEKYISVRRKEGTLGHSVTDYPNNSVYGRPSVDSYLLYVQNNQFKEYIINECVTVDDWYTELQDWREIVTHMRSRSHYLREHVFSIIFSRGMQIANTVATSTNNVEEIEIASNNILMELLTDFKNKEHGCTASKAATFLSSLFENKIIMFRHNKQACRHAGQLYFSYAYGKDSLNSSFDRDMPNDLEEAGKLWGEARRQKAIATYG